MIINTSDGADHVGGNANVRRSPLFHSLEDDRGGEALPIRRAVRLDGKPQPTKFPRPWLIEGRKDG